MKFAASLFFVCTLLFVTACGAEQSQVMDKDAFAKSYGPRCTYKAECGELAMISCMPEVDGPVYYVNKDSGDVVETCGGACMMPSETHCNSCPPESWTCDDPYNAGQNQP